MTKEEFWSSLEAAVSEPDHEKATEAMVAALKQGYEENNELLCAVVPDPMDRNAVRQIYMPVEDRRYFILFTSFDQFFQFARTPGLGKIVPGLSQLSLEGHKCKDILGDVASRSVIGGLAFNPTITDDGIDGFTISKEQLLFVKAKPKFQHVHPQKRKHKKR